MDYKRLGDSYMSVITFAAIDVGSNEICLKIFEIIKKNTFNELTHVRHVLELGSETYANGYISTDVIDELCDVLTGFTDIMKEYDVMNYRAYATSAVREASNRHFILDRIRVRTGINVTVLSNTEQRYLMFQALASGEPEFNDIIKDGSIVVEVGPGSAQATHFYNGKMISSQNLRLGSIRISEFLKTMERSADSYLDLLQEYIAADINTYYNKYYKRHKTHTILAIGEGLRLLRNYINFCFPGKDILSTSEMNILFKSLMSLSVKEIASIVGTSEEQARLIRPTAMIYKQIMDVNEAKCIRFNMADLCDGMVYEYMVDNNKRTPVRNFDLDILASVQSIASKYSSNKDHTSYVEQIALKIFDEFRDISGLSERDRILMQVAIRMHDCGTFVNFQNIENNSADIILSSEIIGISNLESHIIAGIVRHKPHDFPSFYDTNDKLTETEYLKIAKMAAIYRLANSLDASKKQKLSNIKANYKNDKLIISCETFLDITLEFAAFQETGVFFKQIFGIIPILKQRRVTNV